MKRALLLFIAACGRFDFDPHADAAVGTRLRLQYNAFEDGTRQIIGAYDTLLQVPCTATPTSTGFACLPDAAFVLFADAACTQPIIQVPDCGPEPRYAYDPFAVPIAHVYEAGADIATPPMAFQLGADGSCIASSTPTGAYKALAEVPLETFVPLTRELGAGTRLRAQSYVASDGFRLPGDVFDSQANGGCIAATYDDATVCEPYSLGIAYFYTDASCSHVVWNSNVAVNFAIEILNQPLCRTSDMTLRATTSTLTPAQIYVEIPGSGSCAPSGSAPGWIVQDLGPPIAPAPLTRGPVPGSRIQLIEDASGEATSTEAYVYDSQLGVECEPLPAADGVTRCLPRTPPAVQQLFSDAGCTVPLRLIADNRAQCASLPPIVFAEDFTSETCESRVHIYNIGPTYTGPVYTGTPAQCNTYVTDQALYEVGSEVDPTTFSTVIEQIDP
jgi:hypothetical protein